MHPCGQTTEMQRWKRVLAQLDADESQWARQSTTRASLTHSVEAALLARAGCGSVRKCESIVASKARVALVVDTLAPPPYVSALATRKMVGCPCSTPTQG